MAMAHLDLWHTATDAALNLPSGVVKNLAAKRDFVCIRLFSGCQIIYAEFHLYTIPARI